MAVSVGTKKTVNRIALGALIVSLIAYVVSGGENVSEVVATVSGVLTALGGILATVMATVREALN